MHVTFRTALAMIGCSLFLVSCSGETEKDSGAKEPTSAQASGVIDSWSTQIVLTNINKNQPRFSIHNFCRKGVSTLLECQAYDSDKIGARLLANVFFISQEQYSTLPEAQKKFWRSSSDSFLRFEPQYVRVSADISGNLPSLLKGTYTHALPLSYSVESYAPQPAEKSVKK